MQIQLQILLDGDEEQRNKKGEFGCYFSDAWIQTLQLGEKMVSGRLLWS